MMKTPSDHSQPPVRTDDHTPGPVPRAPATTTKPYPPEADPTPDDDTSPAEVAGEQTDPASRTVAFPEDAGDAG